MSFAHELAALFRRDLTRVMQELEAFSDEAVLWQITGGVTNSAGNLALHLEGNLREYLGRQLGGVAYHRTRDLEFSARGVSRARLIQRLSEVRSLVERVLQDLPTDAWEAPFPEEVLGLSLSSRQFVLHLFGHLNYHLGQIDDLRRTLTGGSALSFAGL